ncbi:hypothetical protein EV130_102440 [Rhizobium azibense]|uniref:Tyr recombinase domain-containing protein n=1 Tax=Rhizobium azibense TaxID=1136135 RepID=A0A4R3RUZ7_9HYPH|nr:hypothetical protein [Rhizobium azibense]TCU29260.1 hypothetical protein EV130_102440 [Rhizobium azibense]TCU37902.1 hypothetical protein EV129_105218 [Rhizobium azibense]
MTLDAVRNTTPSSFLHNSTMALLMARLALRPPEVVAIQIDDINWRSGETLIRGKGDRHDRLPHLLEVGKALADYVKLERVTPRIPKTGGESGRALRFIRRQRNILNLIAVFAT